MNRKIDELGRLVIPKEIRRALKIKSGDYLKIQIKGNEIVLTKESTLEELKQLQKQIQEEIQKKSQEIS